MAKCTKKQYSTEAFESTQNSAGGETKPKEYGHYRKIRDLTQTNNSIK